MGLSSLFARMLMMVYLGDWILDPPAPRPRGRPKKKKRGNKGLFVGPRRPRERSKEPEVKDIQPESPSFDNYSFSDAGSSSFAGGYFTRAKKAWLMAKGAGLEFPGSDEDAIRGLEEELREAGYTGY